MFELLREPGDPTKVLEAVELALVLAKWYTSDKSAEDIILFLAEKTNDKDVREIAVRVWISASSVADTA